MKAINLLIVIFLLISINLKANNGFLTKYFQVPQSKVKIVDDIPFNVSDVILVISTRYFNQSNGCSIKKGVHPKYKTFLFVAGQIGDSAYVKPIKDINEIKGYFYYNKDFLVYVDGHGKTFSQTIERGFDITQRFGINVVVYDWPTNYYTIRKTLYNADEVSANFVIAMRNFDKFYSNNCNTSSVSVMFHSMGNCILKNISNSKLLKQMPDSLFDNIIINSAAVKKQNHYKWVEKLDIQKRIYITMNKRDINLQGVKLLRLANQLGSGSIKHMAKNATYVNFSSIATIEHNLFLGNSVPEKNNPDIYEFYDCIFHGNKYKASNNTGFQILSPSDDNFLFSVK